jgi:diguanylate cyclase (GGDEF)-like protein
VQRPDLSPLGQAIEGRRLRGYIGLVGVDREGTIRYASPELEGHYGLAAADFVGRSFLDFIDEADVGQAIESFGGVGERAGHHQATEIRLQLGAVVDRVGVVAENRLDDPNIGLVLLNLADPADRRRSVQLLDAQAEVVRQIALGGTLDVAVGEILAFVERALPGYRSAAYFIGHAWSGDAVAAPSLSPAFTQRMATALRMNASMPGAIALDDQETIIAADLSEPQWAEAALTVGQQISSIWSVPIRYERGADCLGCIEIYGPNPNHPRDEDWTILRLASRLAAVAFDRVRTQDRLIREAEIDPLTGTPNRRVLKSMLANILAADDRGHPVCFIDLDRLKVVNDGLGHEAGDYVIREAARRLVELVGDEGVVGRFGGDEFVAISSSSSMNHEDLAQRCVDAFADPIRVVGRSWHLSASIGVVVVDGQRTPGEILRDADAAMYEAKRAGRGHWQLFEASTREFAVRRMKLEQQLRDAVQRDAVEAGFQPVVRASDWEVCGIETLARWEVEPGVWVPPAEFIQLAEEIGLIDELGIHMVDHAMGALDALEHAGLDLCHVSVNVSPLQLQSGQIFDKIAEAAERGRAGLMCLEMTEQHIIDDTERTLQLLHRLLDLGVGLAVDDFGTGYSSLGALHRMPARMLKIDKRLVEQVGQQAGDAVVAAVVGVAKAYGMATVAEGVETVGQALRLRDLGVDSLQGFLFARPEPLSDMIARLGRPGWHWDVPESVLRDQPVLPFDEPTSS